MTDVARRSWWYYGESPMVASVSLADAQIKTLTTRPLEIIPAPGPSKMVFPVYAILVGHFVSAYNAGALDPGGAIGDALEIKAGSGGVTLFQLVNDAVGAKLAGLLSNIGDFVARWSIQLTERPAGDGEVEKLFDSGISTSNYDNVNMVISIYSAAVGSLTGGHANNTLKITVYYLVVDL